MATIFLQIRIRYLQHELLIISQENTESRTIQSRKNDSCILSHRTCCTAPGRRTVQWSRLAVRTGASTSGTLPQGRVIAFVLAIASLLLLCCAPILSPEPYSHSRVCLSLSPFFLSFFPPSLLLLPLPPLSVFLSHTYMHTLSLHLPTEL